MIKANALWDLFKDLDGDLIALDEQTWQRGQREYLCWNNEAPTDPDPALVAALRDDIALLHQVLAKLEHGWELC